MKMPKKIKSDRKRLKKCCFGGDFGDGAPDGDFFGGGGALPTSDDAVGSVVEMMFGDGP